MKVDIGEAIAVDNVTPELIPMRNEIGKHLEAFDLINMNGRVYDPILGRFLSPDPMVQFPGVVDGYNRYSYVMNNPLIFTDPSGYMPQWVQDEYDHYYRNGGGGTGFDYFGWINKWGHSSGSSYGWSYNIHRANNWKYDWNTGYYVNKFTGERKEANNESTNSVLNDAGFEVDNNIEEGTIASFYLFSALYPMFG